MNKRLFVDMDGTLAHFKNVEKLEALYEQGYFARLAPHRNLIDAIHRINSNPNIDVFILSAVLENSKYAEKEKRQWLQQYLPELTSEQIIFTPCGQSKTDFIPNLSKSDVLLDDYTVNLNDWTEHGGTGVKFVNRINAKHGTWKGYRIYHYAHPSNIAKSIEDKIKTLPAPSEAKSEHIEDIPKESAVTYKVYQCPYQKKGDSARYQIFIAAYDKLDAKALFQLHMPDSDRLLEELITECPTNKLKPYNKCLNFSNPAKKEPEI